MKNTFPKKEHLCSHVKIAALWKQGNRKDVFPLHCIWQVQSMEEGNEAAFQVLFSVSKKKFKHAVDRNRIKRQLRETCRLNQHHIKAVLAERKLVLYMMVLYTQSQLLNYWTIDKAYIALLQHIEKQLTENTAQ